MAQSPGAVLQYFEFQLPGGFTLFFIDIEALAARAPGLQAQQHVGGVVDTAGLFEGVHGDL